MRIYKMFVNVSAGTNDAIAQLDVVEDGKIVAINMACTPQGMDALNDEYRVELNFGSTNTLDNNDVRQSIFEIAGSQQFLTSGGGVGGINHGINGLDLNVLGGERLFLHSFASAGVSGTVSCHIYIADGSGGKTRLRRQR